MDPYLEAHWRDVHTKLITYAADALNLRLPATLIARAEERIAVESQGEEADQFSPDVGVLEGVGRGEPGMPATGSGGVAVEAYRLVAVVEPITERFIEIIDAKSRRVITVIEFLSPTNKTGKGIEAFRHKRDMLCAGNVNVVEIDLVRHGNWRELLAPHSPPKGVQSTYRATVRIPSDPIAVYFYPMSLRQPLPSIAIPLRRDDPPVELELQPLIDQAYSTGRYASELDYTQPPEPPLDPEDAAWAEELLKAAGKR